MALDSTLDAGASGVDLDAVDLSDRAFWAQPPAARHAVGFGGHGPHFCLGAHLARREIGVAFRTLFERLPDLEVTGEPDRLKSSFINGLTHLPAALPGVR